MDENTVSDEFKPISMWGYFGYELLFSIPVVGFIILIIKALTATNINLKNFARSYFCLTIVGIVLAVVCGIIYTVIAGAQSFF